MFRHLAYVFTLVFLAIGGAQAQSIHTMPIGTEVDTKVRFARSEVPLPPGKWTLILTGESIGKNLSGGMDVRMPYVTLIRAEQNALVGMVMISGTRQYENVSWIPEPACARTEYQFLDVDRNFNRADQRCHYVTHHVRTWTAADNQGDSVRNTYLKLRETKIRLPATMLASRTRLVKGGEYLDVTHEIAPQSVGGPIARTNVWSASEWHKDKIADNPEHKRFLDAWVEWSKQMASEVRDGFGRSLSEYAPIAIAFEPPVAKAAVPAATGPLPAGHVTPAIGTRFVTKNGQFEVVKTERMSITTMNAGKTGATWSAGLLPLDTNAKFDRGAIESLFPLAVGKKTQFKQEAASGTNAWDQTLEVVRAESLDIDGKSYATFVIEGRTEAVGPGMNEFIRKRTLHYAPEIGWLLKMQEEQLAGPPQRMNSWEVVRIVPPGG